MQKVRIADIAKLAGVSRMTVSQALNPRAGSVRVSAETEARILELARQLNYRPNLAARQLAGGSAKVVGFILDTQTNQEWIECMVAVEELLTRHGYRMQVAVQHENVSSIEEQVEDFWNRSVDGIICSSHTYVGHSNKIIGLLDRFPNKVVINEPAMRGAVSFVSQDQERGLEILTEHLLERGSKAPYLVTPGISDLAHYTRIRAFKKTLRKHGFTLPEKYSLETPFEHALRNGEDCERLIDQLISLKADGVIVSWDFVAIRLITLLKKRGIRVPEDIRVVSHRHTAYGEIIAPTVTGLDYHFREIGRRTAEMLLEFMQMPADQPRPVHEVFIAPDLYVGESS